MSASATSSTHRSASAWIAERGYRLGPDGYLIQAPVARPSTNGARRDRKQVNSQARQPVRSNASFPNVSNDLRNTGAPVACGLSSGKSAPASKHLLQPVSTAPIAAPINDNEEQNQKRQKSGRAQFRITTPKTKIADDILSLFRKLQAIAGNDQLYAFTLRIDQKLLGGRKDPTNCMQRRIARELKNRLGRDIKFAGVMEWRTDAAGELHLHGAITLALGAEELASEALRVAGGRWRDKQGKARQVDVRPINPQASFGGKFGLEGWALYCSKDTRQTELELNRRRYAIDPQRQYKRAPNIILKSCLQNRRREPVPAPVGTPKTRHRNPYSHRSPYSLTAKPARRSPYSHRSPYAGGITSMAKSQTQRTREYRARIRDKAIALWAERDALKAENADLRRQLAERVGPPALIDPLDKLSPEGRAEFDRLRVIEPFAAMSDLEVLVAINDKFLRSWAKKRLAAEEKAQYAADSEWGMF